MLAGEGGVSGQGCEQHGISTFFKFYQTIMLQSADLSSDFNLHGNIAVEQWASVSSKYSLARYTGSTFLSSLLATVAPFVQTFLYR